jgi:hypothetical protein
MPSLYLPFTAHRKAKWFAEECSFASEIVVLPALKVASALVLFLCEAAIVKVHH